MSDKKVSNITELVQPKDRSLPQILNTLKKALYFARKNDIKSVFTVMVGADGKPYVLTKCDIDHEEIEDLLFAIEAGHEIVYQLGK